MISARTGRILVVGASGQVGSQVLRILPSASTIPTSRQTNRSNWISLDLATITAADADLLFHRHQLETIYCIGGMTNVDACETSSELARRINCEGPAILAAAAAQHAARFIYLSTDYIFNGRTGPYTEDDPADPICAYGRSKWLAELAVQENHPSALIIRTTGVYGVDPAERNFLYSLRKGLLSTHPFRTPYDQISTPTYNLDLASTVVALAHIHAQGIFHVAGPDLLSRLDFARRAAAIMQIDPRNLAGVSTAELSQIAPRPLRAGLLTRKLASALPQLRLRGIDAGVANWLESVD